MNKINFFYLAIIPLGLVLYKMNSKLGQTSAFFYGFAENKETELSHDKSVLISKIWVTPGQAVTKGQLLAEVKQPSFDFKIDNANFDIERFELTAQLKKQELKNRISQLKAKRLASVTVLNTEINELKTTIRNNQRLLKDLKSIDEQIINQELTPNNVRLKALLENLEVVTEPIDVELAQLEKKLLVIDRPVQVQQLKLQREIEYYKTEQTRLKIIAPTDGLIGNVLCKEGENVSAFSKLINFYERKPTMVKGYVHESLILEVKKGDSLIVSSSLHPELKVVGKVIGLGSRIIEIPERLRKIPDFKTYGREVLIQISPDNPFLQKEKVMLNSLKGEDKNYIASQFLMASQN